MNSYQLLRITQDPVDPGKRVRVATLFKTPLKRRIIPDHVYVKRESCDFYSAEPIKKPMDADTFEKREFFYAKKRISDGKDHVSFTTDHLLPRVSSRKVIQDKNYSHITATDNSEYFMGNTDEPPIRGRKKFRKFNKSQENGDIILQSGNDPDQENKPHKVGRLHKGVVGKLIIDHRFGITMRPNSADSAKMQRQLRAVRRARTTTLGNELRKMIKKPLESPPLTQRKHFKKNAFVGCDIFDHSLATPPTPSRQSFRILGPN